MAAGASGQSSRRPSGDCSADSSIYSSGGIHSSSGSHNSSESLVERAINFRRNLEAAQAAYYSDISPHVTPPAAARGVVGRRLFSDGAGTPYATPILDTARLTGAEGNAADCRAPHKRKVAGRGNGRGSRTGAESSAGSARGNAPAGSSAAAAEPIFSMGKDVKTGKSAVLRTAGKTQAEQPSANSECILPSAAAASAMQPLGSRPEAADLPQDPAQPSITARPAQLQRASSETAAAAASASIEEAGPSSYPLPATKRRRASGSSLPELFLQTAEAVRAVPPILDTARERPRGGGSTGRGGSGRGMSGPAGSAGLFLDGASGTGGIRITRSSEALTTR